MWDKISGLVGDAIKPVTNMVDEMHTSKEEKMRMQIELERTKNVITNQVVEAQKEIIVAEAKGGWLQRNWRPILMLSIVAIVVNNYLVYPYLSLFTSKAVILELPEKLWNLMMIGVGGYVAGRSAEKITDTLKK